MSNTIIPDEDRFVTEDQFYRESIPYEEAAVAPGGERTVEDKIATVTRKGFSGMSPAERVTTLTAIKDAVEEQLKWEKSRIIENLTGATENTAIPTAMGNLTFKAPSRPVKVDDEKLLAYVKQVSPDSVKVETIETIDPELRAMLVKDIVDCGDGDFARGSTGETIDYAYLGAETAASIAWPASGPQKVVKAQARRALDEHLQMIAAPMFEALEAGRS